MKKIILTSLMTGFFLTSMVANADPHEPLPRQNKLTTDRDDYDKNEIKQTPEIDGSSATLALGLLSGAIALFSERNRKNLARKLSSEN
jgi:hypothetical protein